MIPGISCVSDIRNAGLLLNPRTTSTTNHRLRTIIHLWYSILRVKKYVLKRDPGSLPEKLTRYQSELNEEQFRVVTAQPQATLVVAGAGYGQNADDHLSRRLPDRTGRIAAKDPACNIYQPRLPRDAPAGRVADRLARTSTAYGAERFTGSPTSSSGVTRPVSASNRTTRSSTARTPAILSTSASTTRPSTPNRNAFQRPRSSRTSSATPTTPTFRSRM